MRKFFHMLGHTLLAGRGCVGNNNVVLGYGWFMSHKSVHIQFTHPHTLQSIVTEPREQGNEDQQGRDDHQSVADSESGVTLESIARGLSYAVCRAVI